MNQTYLPVLIGALLFAPAGIAAVAAGDAEAGRVVYEKTCKMCHGATGQGNPAMVKSSKGALEDLSSKEVQGRTDEQLKKGIAGGTAAKKAIKPLTDKQMQDVLAFVRTLAKK